MVQDIIILVLFVAALAYVVYLIYKHFQPGAGCASGCGSCGIDFRKIEKDLRKKAETHLN